MEHISEPSSITDQSDMPSSWEKGLRSPLTLGLVGCGAVGAFLFTVTYVLEGITRAGYDAWQQPISALSLGPGGWVQQVNFVVYGILTLLSAVGWYRLLSPGRAAICLRFARCASCGSDEALLGVADPLIAQSFHPTCRDLLAPL